MSVYATASFRWKLLTRGLMVDAPNHYLRVVSWKGCVGIYNRNRSSLGSRDHVVVLTG